MTPTNTPHLTQITYCLSLITSHLHVTPPRGRYASFGLLAYDMSRSQSIMRVATTATPVSGSEVRERVVDLAEEEVTLWAVRVLQREVRAHLHVSQIRKHSIRDATAVVQELTERARRDPHFLVHARFECEQLRAGTPAVWPRRTSREDVAVVSAVTTALSAVTGSLDSPNMGDRGVGCASTPSVRCFASDSPPLPHPGERADSPSTPSVFPRGASLVHGIAAASIHRSRDLSPQQSAPASRSTSRSASRSASRAASPWRPPSPHRRSAGGELSSEAPSPSEAALEQERERADGSATSSRGLDEPEVGKHGDEDSEPSPPPPRPTHRSVPPAHCPAKSTEETHPDDADLDDTGQEVHAAGGLRV